MKKNKNIFKILLSTIIFLLYGCETVDLNQTENRSGVSVDLLDPVLTFNYVQLQLPDFVDSANSFTQRVTRQMAMTGGNTYDNAFAPVNSNANWSTGYNILNAIKLMEPKAIEKQEFYALGASKVIRVYVLMTLVDLYGDIPYTDALQGNGNVTPKYDNSALVYTQLLNEIDQAIVVLGKVNFKDSKIKDLYYSSKANWITLANTLKFKIYNNARLAGTDIGISDIGLKMNEIISGGNYIDQKSEDFAFKYGNSRFTPNTRHPLYNDQYETGGGAYIANYFMWAMTSEKFSANSPSSTNYIANTDPRTFFYFCKQESRPIGEDEFTLPGKNRARPDHYNDSKYQSLYTTGNLGRTPFVISNWSNGKIEDGFWGRDHGDNSGIPPDSDKRTVAGIYPVGGKFSTSEGSVQTGGNKGALGAGIMPILLSSYVNFMIAEASLTVPSFTNIARARVQFESGINASIDKVTNLIPGYPILNAGEQTILNNNKISYPAFMLVKYDAASTAVKLEIIIKEYYLASWGNGIEPYNNYRRTGFPSNFQPTVEPISGDYYYTALYPGTAVNNNPNTPSNLRSRKVFWDKANIVLH